MPQRQRAGESPGPTVLFVGVCRLTLIASHCHSLKEKRAVVRKLKDKVRSRFHIALSEVASQDAWQRIVLGFAVVGGDHRRVDAVLSEIARYVTGLGEREGVAATVDDEREVVTFGDERLGDAGRPATSPMHRGAADSSTGDPAEDDWIPEAWRAELDE